MKIIDNLQVHVSNIHIRYEDTISKSYAWGLTMESLEMYTIDSSGEKRFVDRTKQGESAPMLKRVILRRLGVYWRSGEGVGLQLLVTNEGTVDANKA